MKHLVIGLLIVFALFQLFGMVWTASGPRHNETFSRLIEAPPRTLVEPNQNGYLYLLGFAAAGSLDPGKVGYEIWVENQHASGGAGLNYDKPGRSELRIALSPDQAFPAWHVENPLKAFRTEEVRTRLSSGHNQLFVDRYERWLSLKFEDWGFGRPGIARYEEILLAHRLYLADGFSRQTVVGVERLQKDLISWRLVLRHASTIATKVAAQIAIADDLALASFLLSQPHVDKSILSALSLVVSPLTQDEYALRWPMQHQFTLDISGAGPSTMNSTMRPDESEPGRRWFSQAAHLSEQAFDRIERPTARSLFGLSSIRPQSWDSYAAYYDALIRASLAGEATTPPAHDFPHVTDRSFLDKVFNPIQFEPDWGTFQHQLIETDARLRLASLQIVLRRPSAQPAIPTRLAEVGSGYYDPFTGLPMLWSPTQRKIYSVGKDRLDDGGDRSFDISVPAVISVAASTTSR